MDLYDPTLANPAFPNVEKYVLEHKKPAQRVFTSNAVSPLRAKGVDKILPTAQSLQFQTIHA